MNAGLVFGAVALCACGAALPATTSRAHDLWMLEVARPEPTGKRSAEMVKLDAWGRPPLDSRWSLVDSQGWWGNVIIVRIDANDNCDHCPPYRVVARPVGPLARSGPGPAFAVGPTSTPFAKARVVGHEPRWTDIWQHRPSGPQWILETSVDLDGDGRADLARYATGAAVRFQVRVRTGNTWAITQDFTEPYVLDVDDTCPPFPRACYAHDTFDDDGCPDPGDLTVAFAPGSLEPVEADAQVLADVVHELARLDPETQFQILGQRLPAEPADLAGQRALWVRDALARRGVPPTRMIAKTGEPERLAAEVAIRIIGCVAGR